MPISPEGIDPLVLVLSPDGQQVVGVGPDEKAYFYPVAGGEPRAVPGIEIGEQPIQWSEDERQFISTSQEICQPKSIAWTCRPATKLCGKNSCLPIQQV